MFDKYRISENDKDFLKRFDPDESGNKDELKEESAKNIESIVEWQNRLYAESKQAMLVVIQAMDTAGKDSLIRRVFGPINPQGCSVTSFKAPTSLELAHDFLWRVHAAVPPKGMIGIFNRSHYEDVLIVKVHGWIDAGTCKMRYKHIENFEKLLTDSGVRILKFFLYISKDEQKKRFRDRLDDPAKHWKFNPADLEERKLWEKYMEQYEEVLGETSTTHAPWYVIPSNSKPFRDRLVSGIVLKTLEDMNPQFPPAAEGLDKIVIE